MKNLIAFWGFLDLDGDNLLPPKEIDLLEIGADRALEISNLLILGIENLLTKVIVTTNFRFS